MEDHADVYLDTYSWYAKKAEEIVPKPEEVEYPIWLATSPDQVPPLRKDTNHVILELQVDAEEVIILDEKKWGYVVNYWYIPEDEEDAEEHKQQLEKYGIDSESSIYMEDFYPLLKQKIVDSWDRLFDSSIQLSDQTVATLWEIKEEWVVNVIEEAEEWENYEK
jgi:hypothetical protein